MKRMKEFILLFMLMLFYYNELNSQVYGSFTDLRDGKVYKTVKIGTQVWMAENLNADYFRNGEEIENCKDNWEFESLGRVGNSASYNDKKIKSGKLYNCFTVHDSRGLAPTGWHIPSEAEFEILFKFIGNGRNIDEYAPDRPNKKYFLPNLSKYITKYGTGIPCNNCKNWNSEYRNKVACKVCRDNRIIGYTKNKTEIIKGNNLSGFSLQEEDCDFWTTNVSETLSNAIHFRISFISIDRMSRLMKYGAYIRCIKD